MANSLSHLANNLPEGIHRIKCKFRHDDKKCETCGTKHKYCIRKNIFACLFSVHDRPDDGRSISRNVASLKISTVTVIRNT